MPPRARCQLHDINARETGLLAWLFRALQSCALLDLVSNPSTTCSERPTLGAPSHRAGLLTSFVPRSETTSTLCLRTPVFQANRLHARQGDATIHRCICHTRRPHKYEPTRSGSSLRTPGAASYAGRMAATAETLLGRPRGLLCG